MSAVKSEYWQSSSLQVFWGELAPCDHVVQIYENDKVFLDSLEGFIGSGLIAGEGIIIIATKEHLAAIEKRLNKQGFDMTLLAASDQYIGLEASEMLSRFMVNNWPDEKLFFELITSIFNRAQQNNRKVRAFGEMVALLWKQGFNGATVQLENLWNQLHKRNEFSLFCAYPKIGFTQDIQTSMDLICCQHSKIIDGSPRPSTEIYYKAV
ncbi:MAG: MEDS domain-containing protein [Ferruginibacter sp.]